jgi:hypothetical protein
MGDTAGETVARFEQATGLAPIDTNSIPEMTTTLVRERLEDLERAAQRAPTTPPASWFVLEYEALLNELYAREKSAEPTAPPTREVLAITETYKTVMVAHRKQFGARNEAMLSAKKDELYKDIAVANYTQRNDK